ncbi:MAG: ferritin family protein [Phycisphaerae bacterium]|jgi:rubrerythrin
MGVRFDIDEVLETAEQIEKEAGAFFRRAAASCRSPQLRRQWTELAEMEDEHLEVFSAVREHTARATRVVRSRKADSAMATVMAVMLCDIRSLLEKRFTGKFDQQRLLRHAMEFERDTITFFTMLKQSIDKAADRKIVDRVIQEELGHLLLLGGQLAQMYEPRAGKSIDQRRVLGQFPA